jgi:arylsulfate sulfotransferase
VEIHGNEVIVLDRDLQLSWAWNPFVNLDIARAAVLGEKCTPTTVCRPQSPGVQLANDWMHTNTIYYSPWDGNLLISMRNQDWLVKLNYADGAGDGRVLWRMGPGGDFSITTNSTFGAHDIGFPWFSHQHDAEFEFGGAMTGGERTLTLFDNGNTRRATFDLKAHSRCQLYSVDEIARHVNLDRNGDVGTYSGALGSAQVLSNGAMSCDSGSIGSISQTVEIDTSDQLDYVVQWPGSTYRTFRMSDMYTPPTP